MFAAVVAIALVVVGVGYRSVLSARRAARPTSLVNLPDQRASNEYVTVVGSSKDPTISSDAMSYSTSEAQKHVS